MRGLCLASSALEALLCRGEGLLRGSAAALLNWRSAQLAGRFRFAPMWPAGCRTTAGSIRKTVAMARRQADSDGPDDLARTDEYRPAGAPAEPERPTEKRPAPVKRPAGTQKTSVLGDFRLVARLGEGGMGTVYRARQISQRREVALKVLSKTREPPCFRVAPGKARAQAIRPDLDHVHIIRCYAVGESQWLPPGYSRLRAASRPGWSVWSVWSLATPCTSLWPALAPWRMPTTRAWSIGISSPTTCSSRQTGSSRW